MGLNLNDLVKASLSGAKEEALAKIAAEGETKTCKGCGRPAISGSDYCKACADKAARGEERVSDTSDGSEKTSSEKVASLTAAIDWLVDNPGAWLPGVGHLKSAMDDSIAGPDKGPNTLSTNVDSPTPDKMPSVLNPGGAAKHTIPTKPAMESGAIPKAAPRTMQTDINKARPLQPVEGDLIQKESSLDLFKRALLAKRAAEDTNVSISTPKTSALPEDQPSQMARPAEVTSQERMIASNEAAIGYTKRDAKAVPKKRMGEVLDEPAQSKSGDSALHDALGSDLVAKGGAKIASAQLVQKLASQGCTCEKDGLTKGACGLCKIASQVEQELRGRAGALVAAAQGNGQ
jgi:hypothetical protein